MSMGIRVVNPLAAWHGSSMLSAHRALACVACLVGCARSAPPIHDEPNAPSRSPTTARGGGTGAGPAAPAGPEGTAPPEAPGSAALPAMTKAAIELEREGPPRLLLAARAATGAGYDRVVFEFRDGVPGHHVKYVERPIVDCGAGDLKEVEGSSQLEVRLYPANAHTEEGKPTVAERELRPRLPVIREVERTCDFEAVVTWVVGTAAPNRYRAFELDGPPRLVIDIEH